MTSELEKLATEHADRISLYLEDEHNVTMIWHQAHEAYKAGAKAVLEFARLKSYPINVEGHFRVTLEDLEQFVEGKIK